MSIDQEKVIDIVSCPDGTDEVILFITDHLPWTTETNFDHATKLQSKINSYLSFIESGELVEKFPQYSNKKVIIRVIGKYPLNTKAQQFFRVASKIIQEAGFDLDFELHQEKE